MGGGGKGGGSKAPKAPDYIGMANQINAQNDQYNSNLEQRSNYSNAIMKNYLDKWADSTNYYNGDNVGNALYGSVMDRGRKEQERETDSLNTQLRNQGLEPGSEAYNRAMQNLMTSHNDANLLASQNSVIAGANEARAQRASDLNSEMSKINTLSGLIQPRYNAADPMSAAAAQFNAGMSKTNASNSKKGGLLGAGASLGGSYLGSK